MFRAISGRQLAPVVIWCGARVTSVGISGVCSGVNFNMLSG